MPFTVINDEQMFRRLTKYINFGQDYKLIIKFGTEWCQPCIEMTENLENAKEGNNNLLFYSVDVENNEFSDILVEYNIIKIPYVLIFKNNELVDTINKLMPVNEIKKIINI